MKKINRTARLAVCLTALFVVTGCEDEYQKAGEKYQCFIDGEQVYKSNERPAHRGDNWFILNGEKVQVDGCFCMGCIGF